MAKEEVEYRELTKRQQAVLPLMFGAHSIEEGCKNAGISRQTFYRWLKEPVFRGEYERVGRHLADAALTQFKASAIEALEKVRDLCVAARSESKRLKAAALMLAKVTGIIERQDENEHDALLTVKAVVHSACQLDDGEGRKNTEEPVSTIRQRVVFQWHEQGREN